MLCVRLQVCALVKSLARLDMHPWAANGQHQQLQRELALAVAGQQRWRLEVMDLLPRLRRAPAAAAKQPAGQPLCSQQPASRLEPQAAAPATAPPPTAAKAASTAESEEQSLRQSAMREPAGQEPIEQEAHSNAATGTR